MLSKHLNISLVELFIQTERTEYHSVSSFVAVGSVVAVKLFCNLSACKSIISCFIWGISQTQGILFSLKTSTLSFSKYFLIIVVMFFLIIRIN